MALFQPLEARASDALVIATGWDQPSAEQFRDGIGAFEAWRVFDGCAITPSRTAEGGRVVPANFAFASGRWQWADFEACVRALNEAKPSRATNNFLLVNANPGDVDWFDDAGWGEIVEHWRLLARVAREGGLRGLLFDPEPYVPPASQFLYRAQTRREQHSFEEYRAKARERGRATMRAVAGEFPGALILSYFLFGLFGGAPDHPDALAGHGYGLLPSFIDGWLDAAPPEMRFVDGNESAYRYSREEDFNRAFTRIRTGMAGFVSPENRETCRTQVHVGHGIYLDAHVNPTNAPWHIERRGRSPAQCLADNVRDALAAADGVVWIYGEKGRWWPHGKGEAWPEKLPGADLALRMARDPEGFAREATAAGARKNLLENPSFVVTNASGGVSGWWTWQDDRATGRFAASQGGALLAGMSNGVFGQTTGVKPGEWFAVAARVRVLGSGTAGVTVRWKDEAGRWTSETRDRRFVPSGPPDRDGCRRACGLVTVPADARQLVVLLFAQEHSGDGDEALFDDAVLVRLLPP